MTLLGYLLQLGAEAILSLRVMHKTGSNAILQKRANSG